MLCSVCGKDSLGEVCNTCIRSEENYYSKEWTYVEGLIVKKKEDFKVVVSNARISGTAVISTAASGMNSKIDNFSHYIGGVLETGSSSYNGKPAPMIHIKNNSGMERYLLFPQIADESTFFAAVEKAKATPLAGGAAAPAPSPAPKASLTSEMQDKLNKLELLKSSGILSEDEYLKERVKLGL